MRPCPRHAHVQGGLSTPLERVDRENGNMICMTPPHVECCVWRALALHVWLWVAVLTMVLCALMNE